MDGLGQIHEKMDENYRGTPMTQETSKDMEKKTCFETHLNQFKKQLNHSWPLIGNQWGYLVVHPT